MQRSKPECSCPPLDNERSNLRTDQIASHRALDAEPHAGQHGLELAGLVRRHGVVAAAHVLAPDEHLGDGPAADHVAQAGLPLGAVGCVLRGVRASLIEGGRGERTSQQQRDTASGSAGSSRSTPPPPRCKALTDLVELQDGGGDLQVRQQALDPGAVGAGGLGVDDDFVVGDGLADRVGLGERVDGWVSRLTGFAADEAGSEGWSLPSTSFAVCIKAAEQRASFHPRGHAPWWRWRAQL